MEKTYFSHDEAREKVGRPIQALVDLPSVPKGTKGIVLKTKRHSRDKWFLHVEWRLPRSSSYSVIDLGRANLFLFSSDRVTMDICKSDYVHSVASPEDGWAGMPLHGNRTYSSVAFVCWIIAGISLLFVFAEPGIFPVVMIMLSVAIAVVYGRKYSQSKQVPK